MKNITSMFIMCLVVICGACSNEDDYNNSSSSHETQNDQIVITWWFYTFVLNYNMAGQQIYEVAPIDGAKVKVPYFYMLP